METIASILAFFPKLFEIVSHVIQRKHDVENLQQMQQRKTHLHYVNGIKEKIEKP